MPTHLQIIALDKIAYEDDVDIVVLPGEEGQLGVLPRHARIVTLLEPGEVLTRKAGEETSLAISGGFAQIDPDSVTILSDAAEYAEDIDMDRAEEARRRAQERISNPSATPDLELARAESALLRSMARLRVAERIAARRRRQAPGGQPPRTEN